MPGTHRPPVWLLDVDGVLNFLHDKSAARAWPDAAKFRSGNGFNICWSPQMLKRIRAIHDTGLAEVRWLTTWGSQANTFLSETFGLPTLEVAGSPPFLEKSGWWKLDDVRTVHETGVKVVWTDDDIVYSSEALAWLEEVGSERIRCVSPTGGLLPEHLDLIETWLTTKDWTEADRTKWKG